MMKNNMPNNQTDAANSTQRSKIIVAILGAVIIIASVVFISNAADLLPADTDLQNWYISAVVCSLAGWVLLFVGILGARKQS